MAGRYRSVYGVERRGTNQFECLVECKAALYVIDETLEVAQCSMALVAVVDIFLYTKFLQRENTADTEQYLLLQAVFVVSAIERMGDGLVVFRVHFVVGIEQIELDAANIHLPYIGVHLIVHVGNVNNQRLAVLVENALNGQRIEVLCIILCNLLAIHRQSLLEIAVTIEETNGTHVYI